MLLTACSTAPAVVDLSDSVYKPSSPNEGDQYSVSFVKILNKADGGRNALRLHKPTRETVEEDLKRFLADTLPVKKTAPRSLQVTISKAESYWLYEGAATIPIIGILFIDADFEFGINLRVLFEIEQNSKVVSSYLFDERVTIQGKAATPDNIRESYKKVIAEYRKRFFGELETNFLNRYF